MKTIKVRIAVAVDENGNWNSSGWKSPKSDPMPDSEILSYAVEHIEGLQEALYIVTAELAIPEASEVAATVEGAAEPC
jgi:hypothetical protein